MAQKEIPSYKIKVIGLGDNVLKYQYATENGRKEINIVEGENELPTSIKGSIEYQVGYRLTTPGTSVFTITQIPDYPDQLCYDGKMYAIAYDMSILTDYTIIADTNPFLKIFKPFIDKAANNYICKINKFLQMIEEENGLIDIENLLGKSIDNLIVSPVQEYPDMFKGVTIGNGKIRIGLPGINKDIVLDANDIETFKQSLVK